MVQNADKIINNFGNGTVNEVGGGGDGGGGSLVEVSKWHRRRSFLKKLFIVGAVITVGAVLISCFGGYHPSNSGGGTTTTTTSSSGSGTQTTTAAKPPPPNPITRQMPQFGLDPSGPSGGEVKPTRQWPVPGTPAQETITGEPINNGATAYDVFFKVNLPNHQLASFDSVSVDCGNGKNATGTETSYVYCKSVPAGATVYFTPVGWQAGPNGNASIQVGANGGAKPGPSGNFVPTSKTVWQRSPVATFDIAG